MVSFKKQNPKTFHSKDIKIRDTKLCQALKNKTRDLLITGILLFFGAVLLIYFDRTQKEIFFSYGAIILVGIAIYQFYLVKIRYKNITIHPDFQALLRYDEPEKIILQFEKEIQAKKRLYEESGYSVLPNYIVIDKIYRYHVLYKAEIVWVYLLRTKHSVNFIPTGSTYEVIINVNDGRTFQVKCSREEESKELMEAIAKIAPFAIFGYSDELKAYWQTNPVGFINEVYFRQREYHKQQNKSDEQQSSLKKNKD